MYCKYCGQLLDNDSLYCSSCGRQIKSSLPTNEPKTPLNETDRISSLAQWEEIPKEQIEKNPTISHSIEVRMIDCYEGCKLTKVCSDDSISRSYWIENNGVRVSPYFDNVEDECYQNLIIAVNDGQYSLYEVILDENDKYALIHCRNLPSPYKVDNTSGEWFHIDNLFDVLNLSTSLDISEKDSLKLGEFNYRYYGKQYIFTEYGTLLKWKVKHYHFKDFIEAMGQCILLGLGLLLGSFLTDDGFTLDNWWNWITIIILCASPFWGLWGMFNYPSSRLIIRKKKRK